jgi:hypothetical protein
MTQEALAANNKNSIAVANYDECPRSHKANV